MRKIRIASLKNGGKTGKLIERSLFRNRIRIALTALRLEPVANHLHENYIIVVKKSPVKLSSKSPNHKAIGIRRGKKKSSPKREAEVC
jgi:hypothetical protein